MAAESLVQVAEKAGTKAGLSLSLIRQEQWGHGDGRALFRVGDVVIDFFEERGLILVCVGPARLPERLFMVDDIDVAFGWKTPAETDARYRRQGSTFREIRHVENELIYLKSRMGEIVARFDEDNFDASLRALQGAARRRNERAYLGK
jgi:hypothetical protein